MEVGAAADAPAQHPPHDLAQDGQQQQQQRDAAAVQEDDVGETEVAQTPAPEASVGQQLEAPAQEGQQQPSEEGETPAQQEGLVQQQEEAKPESAVADSGLAMGAADGGLATASAAPPQPQEQGSVKSEDSEVIVVDALMYLERVRSSVDLMRAPSRTLPTYPLAQTLVRASNLIMCNPRP